jgi:3-oxoacyl-[acyl-carrier protein] reductase
LAVKRLLGRFSGNMPMEKHAAIVTGGLRGLGRAMSFGLSRSGVQVLAVGHIEQDLREMEELIASGAHSHSVACAIADLRRPEECDRVVSACTARFGTVDILINNAGLTFTYIAPDRFRRAAPQRFWEIPDDVVQAVMDTNYVAADQMTRRVAPAMVTQGWGRIVNVTTKLSTMNMAGALPYGASKAGLEMATQVWAKELGGTGVTVNIVNPGAGANTLGMASEMRERSQAGLVPRLVEPEEMVPPLLFIVSRDADKISGYRFDANAWRTTIPPSEAARLEARPAGFDLRLPDPENWPG